MAITLVNTGPDTTPYETFNRQLRTDFPDLELKMVYNPDHASVDAALRDAPKAAFVVILCSGWTDANGRLLLGIELINFLIDKYNRPVFSFIPEFLGTGLIGGVGVSAKDYGQKTAELGLSLVLDGIRPDAWISSEGFSSTFVDHEALARFGSSPRLIPKDAEIVNPPISLWIRYQILILVIIAALLAAISVLVVFLLSRRRERRLLVKTNENLEQKVADRTMELQASNQELSTTNQNLTILIKRTEEMQETVLRHERELTMGRLTAGVAHELNTPLNVIRSANEAVQAVISDSAGGFSAMLLAMNERQSSLFLRYAPLTLEIVIQKTLTPDNPEDTLARRLAILSREDSVSLAADLQEAGLYALGDAELLEFANADGKAAAQALYQLSVLGRSTVLIDTAIEQAVTVLSTIREYLVEFPEDRDDRPVDLRSSIERALLFFKNRVPAAIAIVTLFENLPPVNGNEAVFVRLWFHLIQNALQAMASGGTLAISVKKDGESAVIAFDDEGEGIPPTIAGDIFLPFVTTKPLAEGLGLGLAYSKKVVEAMHGTISYTSKDRGTIFHVRIPLSKER